MTEKMKRIFPAMFFAALILGIALAALRTVMLFSHFDAQTGYYLSTPLKSIFNYAVLAAVIVILCPYFSYKKQSVDTAVLPSNAFTKISSALCAAAMSAFVFYALTTLALGDSNPWRLAAAVFAIPSAIYFVSNLFNKNISDGRAFTCMANSFFGLVMVFTFYFDRTTPLNSPAKIIGYTAVISAMLAFVAEANYEIAKPAPARYLVFLPASVMLCTISALPDLIYFFAFGMKPLLISVMFDVIIFAYLIYMIAKGTALLKK